MHLIKTNKSNQSLKNSWIFGVLGSSFTGWAHFSRLPGGPIFPVYRVGAFFPFTGWGHFSRLPGGGIFPVYRVGAFLPWKSKGPTPGLPGGRIFCLAFSAGIWAPPHPVYRVGAKRPILRWVYSRILGGSAHRPTAWIWNSVL